MKKTGHSCIFISFLFSHWIQHRYCSLAINTRDKETQGYNYFNYQPFVKIEEELKRINKSSEKLTHRTLFSIGKTFENRTLWGIKIQKKNHSAKKTIVIDCGAHAREWIAPSTCMWLINAFENPDTSIARLLKTFDWVILPVLNPDGYVFAWNKSSGDRLWRKNRSYDKKQLRKFNKTGDPLCIGVDVNRNFNKNWGGIGAPTINPCHEMYAGSKPFSEKESRALAKYLRSVANDIVAYVTLHCYGQLWMTPWGYKSKPPGQYEEMERVARLAVQKIQQRSGAKYKVGKSYDVLYPHSGSSADWVYSELPIPYSYLVEMTPTEEKEGGFDKGFDLPAKNMVKNAKDIVAGISAMASNLKLSERKG